MALPLKPPLAPQLARSKPELPVGPGWSYEPKWDGFRAIVFVDGDEVYIQSRGGKPLGRYFPELELPSGRYVADGELVVFDPDGRPAFEALQQRIHPAASRIELLAHETPVSYLAFDLLAQDDRSLLELSFEERRAALEEMAAEPLRLTPTSRDPADAEPWLAEGEGAIAKELAASYRPGKRKGMVKVKRLRTIDCVVVGYRPGKAEGTVGSLILGLYDGDEPRVVGHTSGISAREKRALVERLAPYKSGELGSADPSRWTAGRDLEWVALRPELVVEIAYDHVSDHRIRHGAKLLRWRDDKAAAECRFEQLA